MEAMRIKMKKILLFILSLVMLISMIGCVNERRMDLSSNNSEISSDYIEDLPENSEVDSVESENSEVSEKDSSIASNSSIVNNDSSSNEIKDENSKESSGWTGIF